MPRTFQDADSCNVTLRVNVHAKEAATFKMAKTICRWEVWKDAVWEPGLPFGFGVMRCERRQRNEHSKADANNGTLHTPNYNSTKQSFVYFGFHPGNVRDKRNTWFVLYQRLPWGKPKLLVLLLQLWFAKFKNFLTQTQMSLLGAMYAYT
jgi:hypothetical protein